MLIDQIIMSCAILLFHQKDYTMQWFVGMVEVWIGLTCVTGSHATRHLDITTPLLGDHSSTD